MKACVTIKDDVVIKTADPKLMRIEVEKTTRAHQIGRASGLFRAPQILDYDDAAGRATFELIRDTKKLRNAITAESESLSLMKMAAEALAVIHKNLTLPEQMKTLLPDEYYLPGSDVFLHGDFGLGNVCVSGDGRQLVIFDWQATQKLHIAATYGTRYFDVMWFIYNLFHHPIGSKRHHIAAPAAPLAKTFLTGYIDAANCGGEYELIRNYMRRFAAIKLMAKDKGLHLKRRLMLIPSHIRLYRFIRAFEKNLKSKRK
jgi:hypothetical protein